MNGLCLFFVLLSGLLLSSCTEGFWSKSSSVRPQEIVAPPPTDADTILSCLVEHRKLSRKEYKTAYKTAIEQAAGGTDKTATLRLICLSLHEYASYKQVKSGTNTLANYVKDHPDGVSSLQGMQMLMQRIEKEMIVKWTQNVKKLDEKEGLEAENKELSERNEVLEKSAAKDQERIKDLHKQIEQLKDIENIIKNRER